MILIPEIETVVLLVPRTASGTLKRAILSTYPKAVMLYRHMEADGVPTGYDRWRKVGIVRDPVARLWSLYKFCKGQGARGLYPAYAERLARTVERPFSEWLVNNDVVFTDPYDSNGSLRFFPQYNVKHALPENRKSQFLTLRPDLGTEIFRFDQLAVFADRVGVRLSEQHNRTAADPVPVLTEEAQAHVRAFFAWDILHSVPVATPSPDPA